MRIAIFDYLVIQNNPIGGCHQRMLEALADEHDFTVFSVRFDNPRPDRIEWRRVPAPLRPLPLLFVVFHLIAPFVYLLWRFRKKQVFDLIQIVESKTCFGDISYSHFCHSAYLRNHWVRGQGSKLRAISRWLDHRLHSCVEKLVYSKVKQIVVPSRGLANEIVGEFAISLSKIRIVPNAINVDALDAPQTFDRIALRQEMRLDSDDIVFVFAALGHFERKGLPLLLSALSECKGTLTKLIVVGGSNDLVDRYKLRVQAAKLQDRVVFTGMQSDIRPYLWAADAFLFASNYETFSLVAFESAAASLPLITPLLYGLEEIVQDGVTGYVVRQTVSEFVRAIKRFTEISPEQRATMGQHARAAALNYSESMFIENWRRFYADWAAKNARSGSALQTLNTAQDHLGHFTK